MSLSIRHPLVLGLLCIVLGILVWFLCHWTQLGVTSGGSAADGVMQSPSPSVESARPPQPMRESADLANGGAIEGLPIAASSRRWRVRCRLVDHFSESPLIGIKLSFLDDSGAVVASDVSAEDGVVDVAVDAGGRLFATVDAYGYALCASGTMLHPRPSDDESLELSELRAVTLYAAGVLVNDDQPYDGVFTWTSHPVTVSVDVPGLTRNAREAEQIHGCRVQLYALANAVPMTGEVALFFERRGVVTASVTMQKLVDWRPVAIDTVGLPKSPGAAGHIVIDVRDGAGRLRSAGPILLRRAQPLHGFVCGKAVSGARCPLPPGE